jgi:hypothetical protein
VPPRIPQVLSRRGIPRDRFANALVEAVRLTGAGPGVSPRMQLRAPVTAQPGGRLRDAGGNTSLYLVVLSCLGMDVTVIDPLPYLEVEHLQIGELKDKTTLRRLELFEKLGIKIDRRDVFTVELAPEQYEVCCTFETIEHFSQSPKPVLKQMALPRMSGHLM